MFRAACLAIALAAAGISDAAAQVCNSPSGFLKAVGTITIGDTLVLGPDCNSVQDAGSSGTLSLSVGTTNIVGAVTRSLLYNTGGKLDAFTTDWLTPFETGIGAGGGSLTISQAALLNNASAFDAYTLLIGTRTSTLNGNGVALTTMAVNDNTSIGVQAYGGYTIAYRKSGAIGGATGKEIDTVNFQGATTVDPFQQNIAQVIGQQMAAGAALSPTGQFPASAAYNIQNNNSTFDKAINIGATAITGTNGIDGNIVPAITMATGHAIKYYYGAGAVNWTLNAGIGVNADYAFTSTGTGSVSFPSVKSPLWFFGSGSPSTIQVQSANTGFSNSFVVQNGGTASNAGTFVTSGVNLTNTSNGFLQFVLQGGATPSGSISSGAGITGGLTIQANAGTLTVVNPALGTPVSGIATNLTGTAAGLTAGNATKLATPRAIGIGGSTGLTATGANFDGSAAINPALAGTLLVANGGTGGTTPQSALANLKAPYIFAQSAVQNSHTGDLLETTLGTITIPANAMGANGCTRVTFLMSFTNSANNKITKLYFGGTGGVNYIAVTNSVQGSNRIQSQICNRAATNSQVGNNFQAQGGFGASAAAPPFLTSAIDTTVSVTVVITGQLANTGESIALEMYSAELMIP